MTQSAPQYVEPRFEQGVLVLTITAADISGDELTDAMRREMFAVLESASCRHTVLDLHRVQYLASSGIRLLLGFRRQLNERSGRMVLCGLNELTQDVLNTARLIGPIGSSPPVLFETAPDAAAGVAWLAGQRAQA